MSKTDDVFKEIIVPRIRLRLVERREKLNRERREKGLKELSLNDLGQFPNENKRYVDNTANATELGKIFNGTTGNRYFLTPTITDMLKENLRFKNNYEVIWGTKTEIEQYFFELFKVFLEINSDNSKIKKLLWQLPPLEENPEIKKENGIIYKRFTTSKKSPQERLWLSYKDDFIRSHMDYFKDEPIKKLPKKLDKFYENYLSEITRPKENKKMMVKMKHNKTNIPFNAIKSKKSNWFNY